MAEHKLERFVIALPGPAADAIRELADFNGFTIAQTIRILIRYGFTYLDVEVPNGTD